MADAVSSADLELLRDPLPADQLHNVRYPQPKPRPVTTVHRKYLLRILEQIQKDLSTLRLQHLQPGSPTIFIVCAAGPFHLRLSAWPRVRTGIAACPYSGPVAGPNVVFLSCPSRNSFRRLRLERFRTSHARVDGNVPQPEFRST